MNQEKILAVLPIFVVVICICGIIIINISLDCGINENIIILVNI